MRENTILYICDDCGYRSTNSYLFRNIDGNVTIGDEVISCNTELCLDCLMLSLQLEYINDVIEHKDV